MNKRTILTASVLSFALLACAAFPYKWFGIAPLEGQILQGVMKGPEPKDDLPLSTCQPDEQNKGKCIIMLTAEFENLRADLIDTKERLRACENQ